MAELLLSCLGEYQVTLAGVPLTAFPTHKGRALLVYLVLERHLHQRTALAQFLWPGYRDDSARHSLRQALHSLRQLLPDAEAAPWLRLTRQTVELDPAAPVSSDVATFRALCAQVRAHAHGALASCQPCREHLRQAVGLYHGDFLAGFTIADSEPFEEWRRVTQEQLHLEALDALSQLAAAAEAAGDDDAALEGARALLAVEPWHEAAHRRVMRLLASRGQRAAAMAQYRRCQQVLAEDLHVAPDAETTALYAQIQRGSLDTAPGSQHDGVTAGVDLTPSPRHSVTPSPTLPAFASPLVGRTRALAAIDSLLQRPGVRLVTLLGPGGMGKTRLAVEVGSDVLGARLGAYTDGVVFVPLASLGTPAALVGAIAAALGLALSGGDPRKVVFQALRPKHLLLILDNIEHLLVQGNDAVDLIVDLLAAAPGVQLLVTSREQLKLRSEHVYAVQALSFSATASLAEATASPAVRLFVQAVQRVDAAFALTAANLAAVLRICHLVQGMPLGLELAAANATSLPLTAIADAIAQSAEFLTVAWRDVPERQRSMRAVFGWSWQLLSAEECRILRQCAVFRGGFVYAAAQIVTGATPALLTRLTDTSLLQFEATASGEGRYSMHELLRQFAAEELDVAGERAAVEDRHGRYYLAYLAARAWRLGRDEPREASSEIQVELDNVRLAWQWAVANERVVELAQATYAWWQFCQFGGLELDGRHSFGLAVAGVRGHLARLTAAGGSAAAMPGRRLLSTLLAIHAQYLFAHAPDEDMAAQAREAIALGAASGGVEGETWGTFVLGMALQNLERKHEAGEVWQRTIALVRRYQGDHPQSGVLHEAHWKAQYLLRGTALHFGDYAASRAYILKALQICQTLRKRWAELLCCVGLAEFDSFTYDVAAAEAGFVAALDRAHSLGFRRAEMDAQGGLGGVLRLRGDYAGAHRLLEQAVGTAHELAVPYDEALLLAALVRLDCQLGDQAAAAQRLHQLMQLVAHVELAKECQLYCHLAAATVAQHGGALVEALHYAEQAEQVNRQGGDILFRLVDTALVLGHARAAVGQWDGAAVAFQQALDAFERFGNRALAAEPQAGLAQIALAWGDLAGAQAHIDAVLPVLAEQPRAGYTDPFFIYLTGYRVLAATGDPRADGLLQQGYELLHHDAAALDEGRRESFVSGVPVHRDLATAYTELQANAVAPAAAPTPLLAVAPGAPVGRSGTLRRGSRGLSHASGRRRQG